ncbi:beta-galactosidase [Paenibacillus sp. CAA11]|uniref:beta-galactosidase n=1 Tax=Paenibacillus sp. CAA11 TaxID=1532905 RepID=UPI000D366B93|nr:beta-galactosidase [Paenibacillus sp. CAA11]AWB44607.1 beta-galactosidase [Paenibacillus sp. CAA11]
MTHKPAEMTYDHRSFLLNGTRVFLNSAAVHYFRSPKEEWREVLMKAKLAGMNCIDTYFAWNVHEPNEGVWDFEGDRDCGAFLDLCAELVLWVIARPGPFICAEWDFGGFPWWLSGKEDVKFREYNEAYLHYVDIYFDKLIPLLRERQISSGGPVILVQVENEYGYLQADEQASRYMNYLRDGLISRGITVPLITCVGGAEGTVEGANFWSGADKHYVELRAKQPDAPKLVTEFWTGWFEHWGGSAASQKTASLYEKHFMEVIRAGFTGISHYMFYGGTNFNGYGGRTVGASDIFMVTSYDYNAPLNEYGRITDKYAAAKRLSYFLSAFQHLLLEAEEITAEEVRASKGITVRGRGLSRQKIWFVESRRDERATVNITLETGRTVPLSIAPGQIVPILDRVQIAEGVYLTSSALITGNEEVGGELTLFAAADRGQRSWIELEAEGLDILSHGLNMVYEIDPDRSALRLDLCHFEEPAIIRMMASKRSFRLVVLDQAAMNRLWRVNFHHDGAVHYVLGPDDMDTDSQGKVLGMMDDPDRSLIVLGGRGQGGIRYIGRDFMKQAPLAILPPVTLHSWESSRPAFVTDGVPESGQLVKQPVDFTRYGQDYGYLLYECDFENEEGGATNLMVPNLQDSARIYVNGEEQAIVRQLGAAGVRIQCAQGRNKLQMLIQHMGRLNFSPYLGESKGMKGPVYLGGEVMDIRRDWQAENEVIHLDEVRDPSDGPLLRRSFLPGSYDRAIIVGAVSRGLRVNGQEVLMEGYHDWFAFNTVDISQFVQPGQVNKIEMPYSAAPIHRLELLLWQSADELTGWRISGNEALRPRDWKLQQLGQGAAPAGNPVWYRCKFDKPTIPNSYHVRLKLRLTGMSKGFILLNGHHLGRYWQIGPQEDYKVPVIWLQEENELLLFDEAGHSPEHIRLLYDKPSIYPWFEIPLDGDGENDGDNGDVGGSATQF